MPTQTSPTASPSPSTRAMGTFGLQRGSQVLLIGQGFTDDGFKLGGRDGVERRQSRRESSTFRLGGPNRSSTGVDETEVDFQPAPTPLDQSNQGPFLRLAPVARLATQRVPRRALSTLTRTFVGPHELSTQPQFPP